MLAVHATDGWFCNAVPVSAAEWDAGLKTQQPEHRPVFQRVTKLTDILTWDGIVLFQNIRVKGDG